MSGINIMTQYQHYFGVADIGGATGLIFSLFYAGAMVGIAGGPFLSDRFGRRMPIIVGSIVALCGAIIQATSFSSNIHLQFCLTGQSNNFELLDSFSDLDPQCVSPMVLCLPSKWLTLSGADVSEVFS
jgi:MFS family permease